MKIDDYEIVSKLGEGNFGIVLCGLCQTTGKEVAIKIEKENEIERSLLQHEAQVLLTLKGCDGIPNMIKETTSTISKEKGKVTIPEEKWGVTGHRLCYLDKDGEEKLFDRTYVFKSYLHSKKGNYVVFDGLNFKDAQLNGSFDTEEEAIDRAKSFLEEKPLEKLEKMLKEKGLENRKRIEIQFYHSFNPEKLTSQ